MNQNDHLDPKLIQQIDHLVETKQPSGIPVADDLATTVPQPRLNFQEQLEDRLIAQIQVRQNGQGVKDMTSLVITSDSTRNKNRNYVPLTLVAAILAVLVVGSVLLARGGKAPNPGLAVLFQETATPPATPIPVVNIIVAYQDLPRGYQFPYSIEQLAKVVGYVPWPESSVPVSAFTEGQDGLEKPAGQILRTDVFPEQPILSTFLVNDLSQIANAGSDFSVILPRDRVAISLPLYLLTGATAELQMGTQVNITLVDSSNMIAYPVARNAVVVHVGDFRPSTSTTAPDVITLAVLPDEAELLTQLANAHLQMTLEEIPAIATSQAVPEAITNPEMPPEPEAITSPETPPEPALPVAQATAVTEADTIAITVPTDQISAQIGVGIQQGDHVRITAQYIFANVTTDGELQLVTPEPFEAQLATPVINSASPNELPQMISQVVINDAIVLQIDSATANVTFGVLPQEAGVLWWALEHQVKLTVELQGVTATTSGQIPAEKVTIPNDAMLISANANQLKAGDHVSIATHFIITNLDNEFQSIPADPSSITMDMLVTSVPPISITPAPLSPDQQALVVSQTIIPNATVVSVSSTGITFAVTQEEATFLHWVLEARLPVVVEIARP